MIRQRPYWKINNESDYYVAKCSRCKYVILKGALPHKCPGCNQRMDKYSYKNI